MQVSVDRDRCCGSGMCALTAPEVFDQDDTGTVLLLAPQPGEDHHSAVTAAADSCPASAIKVT